MPLRTLLHKCDVTYVVSPAYKGRTGSTSPEIKQRTMCTAPEGILFHTRQGQAVFKSSCSTDAEILTLVFVMLDPCHNASVMVALLSA